MMWYAKGHEAGFDARVVGEEDELLVFGYDAGFTMLAHFKGWSQIGLGLHIDFFEPNIEIHLPFVFFRIGVQRVVEFEQSGIRR